MDGSIVQELESMAGDGPQDALRILARMIAARLLREQGAVKPIAEKGAEDCEKRQ